MGFFSEQALWLGYHWSTGAIVVEYPSQGVIELLPEATNDPDGSETHNPFTMSRKRYLSTEPQKLSFNDLWSRTELVHYVWQHYSGTIDRLDSHTDQ